MNSYGDPSSARGRAQAPGPSVTYGSEADWSGNGGSDHPVTAGARAAVPSAKGAASVSTGPVGRATVGRAVVPVRPAYDEGGAGRTSVGAPVTGRATVGCRRSRSPRGGSPRRSRTGGRPRA